MKCQEWNDERGARALAIVGSEIAGGNPHALGPVPNEDIRFLNGDEVARLCEDPAAVACIGGFGDIVASADRNPVAIAQTIVHERQHGHNRGRFAGSEDCAKNRGVAFFLALSASLQTQGLVGPQPAYTTWHVSSRGCF